VKAGIRDTGIGNRDSGLGVRSQELGVRSQELGAGLQILDPRSYVPAVGYQPSAISLLPFVADNCCP